MKKMETKCSSVVVFGVAFLVCSILSGQEAPPGQLEAALSYKPVQKDVDIDLPTPEDAAQCEIRLLGGKQGFIVTTPQKTTLRIFLDTNADGQIDQFSYFKNGVEVYRDIDSDANGAIDQFRWLNGAGTRWGEDTKKNGKIGYWKTISAEEVSREIVMALATNDLNRFLSVALTADELKTLELGTTLNETVAGKIAKLEADFAAAAKAVALDADVQWFQLGAVMPGLVPAGDRGNKKDLIVYENALATVVDKSGTKEISVGTLVKISDGNWRVIDLPNVYDEAQYRFTFIPPSTGGQAVSEPTDSEVVALINEYRAILDQIPTLPEKQRPEKHKEVILCMLKIVRLSTTAADRDLWIGQIADTIMYAVERNEFPEGGEQIKTLYETVKKGENNIELSAHVRSCQIMTDYFLDLYSGEGDAVEKQLNWVKSMEEFTVEFEGTAPCLEVMNQLASYRELSSESSEEALKWYAKIVQAAGDKPIAKKAQGAIRRLTSTGKEIPFQTPDTTGKAFNITSLKGNYVLLCFWDERVVEELGSIKAVADKFAGQGLKVVGVNMDFDAESMKATVAQLGYPWPQLFTPGGLDGAAAVYWGIQNTPYMILYGKDGKVANPNVLSSGDLQRIMAELTK